MRKLIALILMWLVVGSIITIEAKGENANWWISAYGSPEKDAIWDGIVTHEGDIILGGYTYWRSTDSDPWFLMLDSNGNIKWQFMFEVSSQGDEVFSVTEAPNRDIILVGRSYHLKGGWLFPDTLFIFAFDYDMAPKWGKMYYAREFAGAFDAVSTADNSIIIAASTADFGAGGSDFWIINLDSNGNIKWQKTYGGESADQPYSITIAPNGDIIVAGITSSFSSSQDIWVLRLDKSGNIKWQKSYGGNENEETYALAIAPNGDIILAGWTSSFGAGGNDVWILRLDPEGNIIWQKTYGGDNQDYARDMVIAPNGDIIVVGGTESFGDNVDIWVLRLDPNGNIKWQKTIGSEDSLEIARAVGIAPNGNIVVSGVVDGDGMVLSIPPDGNIPNCAHCKDSNAQVKITNIHPVDTTAKVTEPDVQLQDNKPGYLTLTTAEVKDPWVEHSTQQDTTNTQENTHMDTFQGLVAYYSFNHCDASDDSGNGYDGRVHGDPKCVDGVRGKAFEFDGNDDYIELPTFDAIWEEGFSVCAWAKFGRNKSGSYERIIDLGNGDGDTYGNNIWFGRFRTTNDIAVESWDGTHATLSRATTEGGGRLVAKNGISVGEFAFYCAVVDKYGHMAIYKNGILIAEKKGIPVANVVRKKNYIAHSNWPWFDPNFKGIIDEVHIYNRALSEEEIKALYSEAFTNHIKLVVNDIPVAFVDVEVWKDGQLIETATSDLEGNVYLTHEIGPEYTLKILGEEYPPEDVVVLKSPEALGLTNITFQFRFMERYVDDITNVEYVIVEKDRMITKSGTGRMYQNITMYMPEDKRFTLKITDKNLPNIEFGFIPKFLYGNRINVYLPPIPQSEIEEIVLTPFQIFIDTFPFRNFRSEISPGGNCFGMTSVAELFYAYRGGKYDTAPYVSKLILDAQYLRELSEPPVNYNASRLKEITDPEYGVIPYTNYHLAILLHQFYKNLFINSVPSISEALEKLRKGSPVHINISGEECKKHENGYKCEPIGHALIATGYIKTKDNEYYLIIYDPNFPNMYQIWRYEAKKNDIDIKFTKTKYEDVYVNFMNTSFSMVAPLEYESFVNEARKSYFTAWNNNRAEIWDLLQGYILFVSPLKPTITVTEKGNKGKIYYRGTFYRGTYITTIPYSAGYMEFLKYMSPNNLDIFYAVIIPSRLIHHYDAYFSLSNNNKDLDPYTIMIISKNQIKGFDINSTTNVITQITKDGYILNANGTGEVKVTTFTVTNISYKNTTLTFQGANVTIQLNDTTVQVDLDGDGEIEEVISPPNAEFTFIPDTTGVSTPVTFDASASYDLDGSIVRYIWDFGDGTNAEGKVVTHSYSRSGVYTVTLTVTDADGVSTSISKTITIKPIIFFVPPTPEDNAVINQTYVFINITSSEPLETAILEWNGKNITMKRTSSVNWYINITGLAGGTYTFKVWAKDTNGNLGVSETRTIALNAPNILTNKVHSTESTVRDKFSTYKQYFDKILETLDEYSTKLPLDTKTAIVLIVLVLGFLLLILRRR